MQGRDLLLFGVATLIWGSTWFVITFQLGVVPPEWSVVYRFALAAAIMFAVCVALRQQVTIAWQQHGFLMLLGTLYFGLNYVAIYQAERHVPSGLVAVLFSTMVLITPFLMRIAFGTPLRLRVLLAAVLGVTGVALIFAPVIEGARSSGTLAAGIAIAMGGTLCASLGNIVAVRNHRANLPTMPAMAWGMLYGTLSAALAAIVLGAPLVFDARPAYVLSLLYLAVLGSVVAFGAYFMLLKRAGAGPASFVAVSTPVLAMLLSTVAEGYRWTLPAVAGLILAIAGSALILRPPRA